VVYCVDTSAFIEFWRGAYARDVFSGAWDRFQKAFEREIFIAPDEVYLELTDGRDGLSDWARSRRELFRTLDEDVQTNLSELMIAFPQVSKLPDERYADPIVVALAHLQDCTVVSQEGKNDLVSNPNGLPAIPNYCDFYSLRHLRLLHLFRELGWKF